MQRYAIIFYFQKILPFLNNFNIYQHKRNYSAMLGDIEANEETN